MTHPPKSDPVPVRILSFCCPEAQADGVPCTSLGRNCEDCPRAVAIYEPTVRDDDSEVADDWAV